MRYLGYTLLGALLAVLVIVLFTDNGGTQITAPVAASMVVASDGSLWLGGLVTPELIRIAPSGTRRQFDLPPGGSMQDLTPGRHGTMWFTYDVPRAIGSITPTGRITWLHVPGHNELESLVVTADGTIWYSESGSDRIFRRTPTATIISYAIPQARDGSIDQLVIGPDGQLWWADSQSGLIGALTSAGQQRVWRITAAITAAQRTGGAAGPNSLIVGPDRALWFADAYGIGRITTTGRQRSYAVTPAGIGTGALTLGKDGALWFTNNNGYAWLGRLSLSGDASTVGLPDANGVGLDDIVAWRGMIWAGSNTQPAIFGISP